MMMSPPELFASLTDKENLLVRFFFHKDPEPTDWGTWVISPTGGYWEIGNYGPFPIREASKCQFLFFGKCNDIVRLMEENGFVQEEPDLFTREFKSLSERHGGRTGR